MLECIIMGGSIAVGLSQIRKECSAYVQRGISSSNFVKRFDSKISIPAKVVIISLGANDYKINTKEHILAIRKKVKATHIFWLTPDKNKKPDAVKAVEEVAKEFSDTVIPHLEPSLMNKDGIYPTTQGYKDLAERTRVKNK